VAARERVQETVEQTFGREMELFPEFTALIGWGPGGSIDWHHDANRDYLAQRDYAAVLHLSKSGADFGGGDFCFRDGHPARVAPAPGKLVGRALFGHDTCLTPDAARFHPHVPRGLARHGILVM